MTVNVGTLFNSNEVICVDIPDNGVTVIDATNRELGMYTELDASNTNVTYIWNSALETKMKLMNYIGAKRCGKNIPDIIVVNEDNRKEVEDILSFIKYNEGSVKSLGSSILLFSTEVGVDSIDSELLRVVDKTISV